MEESSIVESEIHMNSLRRDLDSIASLQADLLEMDEDSGHSEPQEMDVEEESLQDEDDVLMDDNIVEVEIETETEEREEEVSPSLIPEPVMVVKEQQSIVKTTTTLKAIAPKPAISTPQRTGNKANIIQAGGQQIVLIQSPGGTANAVSLSTGQPIKLITQSGKPVNLPGFQQHRQQLVQTTDGNLILRTTLPKNTTQANAHAILKTAAGVKRFVQPVTTKKIIVPTTQTVKTDSPAQMVKLISSTTGNTTSTGNTTPSKTISLQQAQEMGLITPSQIQQLIPHSVGTNKIIINKSGQQKTSQLVKVTPNFTKSPAKILPAPKFVQKAGGQQKVLIKQGNQLKTGIINTGGQQVLRIPANQLANTGQIHQINLPGQGVQYVRLVNTSSSNTNVSTSNVNTSSATTVVRAATTSGQQKLSTIVPVALVDRSGGIQSGQSLVKVVPISQASGSSTVRQVAPKTLQTTRTIVAASGTSHGKVAVVPSSPVNQGSGTIVPTTSGNSIVMLPSQFVQQLQQEVARASTPKTPSPPTPVGLSGTLIPKQETKLTTEPIIQEITARPPSSQSAGLEPNGIRPRKPCNCTKSQCLKLYCDCFANGEFCHMCNCVNCFNNLDNEEERHKAIRSCLERNPSAFRPKIGKGRDHHDAVRKHTKGCNCKRSGCLKNYCECYEAKIACSNNCKCVGCRNIEDSLEKKSLRPIAPLIHLGDNSLSPLNLKPNTPVKPTSSSEPYHKGRYLGYNTPNVEINFRPMLGNHNKQAFAFMTNEVIEATVQCLLASAEMAEKKGISACEEESTVLKEFGRCLVEIINTAKS